MAAGGFAGDFGRCCRGKLLPASALARLSEGPALPALARRLRTGLARTRGRRADRYSLGRGVPALSGALWRAGRRGLLVGVGRLAREWPGFAGGELLLAREGRRPPPAAPPVCANAKPGVAAIKAAVRIARVGLWVIMCSL